MGLNNKTMIDITKLTKRVLTPSKIRLAMTSKSINDITPLIKELWAENVKLQRVVKENQVTIDIMMDTMLEDRPIDSFIRVSHVTSKISEEDAEFINDTVIPFYKANKNK